MSSTEALLQNQEQLAMYRCTSETSLDIYFRLFFSTFFFNFFTFTVLKPTSMFRCTSDNSLDIYSTATSGFQMAKDNCVRFQITNQSGDVLKAPSEKVISDNNPPRMIEPLSESGDLGLFGRSRKIVESFNMEDFWHALFLGKYFFLHKTQNNSMCADKLQICGETNLISWFIAT